MIYQFIYFPRHRHHLFISQIINFHYIKKTTAYIYIACIHNNDTYSFKIELGILPLARELTAKKPQHRSCCDHSFDH